MFTADYLVKLENIIHIGINGKEFKIDTSEHIIETNEDKNIISIVMSEYQRIEIPIDKINYIIEDRKQK